MILCNKEPYDRDLDRFFLELPINGIRSRHSLRAYAYDVLVWLRFLADACSKTVWQATHDDIAAYYRTRRRDDADHRISAASWNRAVACLDRLYRWAKREELIAEGPFTHRTVWRRGYGGRRSQMAARNEAYEPAARQSDTRFVTLDDYRVFRDVGLRGLTIDGIERQGARDRNGIRNALFAELLVTTGLRLEEASSLMAFELAALDNPVTKNRQVWFNLPPALTKGDRGRGIVIPRRILEQISAYTTIERTSATRKFAMRSGWHTIDNPIFIFQPQTPSRLVLRDGGSINVDVLTPDERTRIILCDNDGTPRESAIFWLTEVGQPVQPNSWDVIFSRASRRCAAAGFSLEISPHQLRHYAASRTMPRENVAAPIDRPFNDHQAA